MTIRTWIQLPVCGKLGLMFRPKKPSSHRINRITTIVHNMRFLLLSDSLSMMILHGGLSVAHQLQDLELIDPYGPVLILQQTLPDRIHRLGSVNLRQLGEAASFTGNLYALINSPNGSKCIPDGYGYIYPPLSSHFS